MMKITTLFTRNSAWLASCLVGVLVANNSVVAEDINFPPPLITPAFSNVDCDQCLISPPAVGESCAHSENSCVDGTCGNNNTCSSCNLGEPYTLNSLFKDSGSGEEPWLNVGGWTQWGYTSNSTGLFNTTPNSFNNNQTYLYFEKVADGSKGLDWGFRADVVYGIDAADTQAFGASNSFDNRPNWNRGIYGWAIPQLYAEFASGDWSIKLGRFYTLAGYEVVTAPDNFFYSHAFTMYNSEPFTHSGALATYKVNDKVEVYGGWTAGWDTGFDRFNNGSNFLGGVSAKVSDDVTVTYITTIGNFGLRGEGYMHSLVADVQLTEKLNYVFQSDLLETNTASGVTGAPNHTIGVNQYLFYTINDCFKAGGRLEWWKSNGESVYSATVGLNYKPHANIVIRPEIRRQWGSQTTISGIPVSGGVITGIDAIVSF